MMGVIKNIIYRDISIFELFVQSVIIFISIFSIGHVIIYYGLHPGLYSRSDFHTFIEAARGNYLEGWIYKNYIAILFKPLLLFKNEMTALFAYSSVTVVCMMLLVHKMFEVKYGWILVVATLPFYKDTLQNHNTMVILAYLACFPLPALLVILVKPHYFVFALSHTIATRYRVWVESRTCVDKNFKYIPSFADLLHFYEKKRKAWKKQTY
jgi:hypothetical protein